MDPAPEQGSLFVKRSLDPKMSRSFFLEPWKADASTISSLPPCATESSAKSATFQHAHEFRQVQKELHERSMTEGHEPLHEKWRRFRKRPPEDRMLILRAALILPLTKNRKHI